MVPASFRSPTPRFFHIAGDRTGHLGLRYPSCHLSGVETGANRTGSPRELGKKLIHDDLDCSRFTSVD
jgi:hypothetical protein